MRASKLGPHSIIPTQDARLMVEAGCRLIKMLDDFGSAPEFLSINPGLVIIGRVYSDIAIEYYMGLSSPEVAARSFIDNQRDKYRLNPAIKLWEGHNEPALGTPSDPETINRFRWFARFEAERIRLLADMGLRAVACNWSTGYPELQPDVLQYWQVLLPMLHTLKEKNGILGLHEYAAPWIWWWTGDYQNKNCDDRSKWRFPAADGFDAGWLTLRYRQVYAKIMNPAGLGTLPLAITEFGCDAAGGGCGMPNGAWTDLVSFWNGWDGSRDPIDYWRGPERDPAIYYAKQMEWYDDRMQEDDFVIGAVPFTFGPNNTAWNRFRIDGTAIATELIRHVRESDGGVTPPPVEEPTSMAINFSNLDYTKTYHVRNNINLPIGMKFVCAPASVRVTWKDIDPTSPTFGQQKGMNQDFAEDEVQEMRQAQMPDIPFPDGKEVAIKDFLGWKPRWSIIYFSFVTVPGTKYKLTWPVRPEAVSGYNPDNSKIYAPDPASVRLRIVVRPGEVDLVIDGLSPDAAPADRAWLSGRNFVFGIKTDFVAVIDAIQDVMTVGLETLMPHGLPDNDIISWIPTMTVVSTPSDPNPGDSEPAPEGTLREAAARAKAGAVAIEAGVAAVKMATDDINAIIG